MAAESPAAAVDPLPVVALASSQAALAAESQSRVGSEAVLGHLVWDLGSQEPDQ